MMSWLLLVVCCLISVLNPVGADSNSGAPGRRASTTAVAATTHITSTTITTTTSYAYAAIPNCTAAVALCHADRNCAVCIRSVAAAVGVPTQSAFDDLTLAQVAQADDRFISALLDTPTCAASAVHLKMVFEVIHDSVIPGTTQLHRGRRRRLVELRRVIVCVLRPCWVPGVPRGSP